MNCCFRVASIVAFLILVARPQKALAAQSLALEQDPTAHVAFEMLDKFPLTEYQYVLPGNGLTDVAQVLIAASLLTDEPNLVSLLPLSEFKNEDKYSQPKQAWLSEWKELGDRLQKFVQRRRNKFLFVDVYNQGRTLRNLGRTLPTVADGAYKNFDLLGVHSQQSVYDYTFWKQKEDLGDGKSIVIHRFKTPWSFFNKPSMQQDRLMPKAPLNQHVTCCGTEMGSQIKRIEHALLHNKNLHRKLRKALK